MVAIIFTKLVLSTCPIKLRLLCRLSDLQFRYVYFTQPVDNKGQNNMHHKCSSVCCIRGFLLTLFSILMGNVVNYCWPRHFSEPVHDTIVALRWCTTQACVSDWLSSFLLHPTGKLKKKPQSFSEEISLPKERYNNYKHAVLQLFLVLIALVSHPIIHPFVAMNLIASWSVCGVYICFFIRLLLSVLLFFCLCLDPAIPYQVNRLTCACLEFLRRRNPSYPLVPDPALSWLDEGSLEDKS